MLIKSDFHASASALGIFDAFIGFGLLLGGITVGIISPKKAGLWFVSGLGIQGLGMGIVAFAPYLWVAYLGNFLLGFAVMIAVIPLSTLFQTLIPSDMRGRVSSVSSIAFNISIPTTYGAVGALADHIGAQMCYAIGAILLIGSMVIGFFNRHIVATELFSTGHQEDKKAVE